MSASLTIDEPAYFDRLAEVEAAHWWSLGMWRLASHWLSAALRGRRGLQGARRRLRHRADGAAAGAAARDRPGRRARSQPRGAGARPASSTPPAGPRQRPGTPVRRRAVRRRHLLRRPPAPAPRGRPPGGVGAAPRAPAGRARAGPRRTPRAATAADSGYRLDALTRMLRASGFAVLRALVRELPARAGAGGPRTAGAIRSEPIPSGGGLQIRMPHPWINRLMKGVAEAEAVIAGRLDARLPFGHSTMVLAQWTEKHPDESEFQIEISIEFFDHLKSQLLGCRDQGAQRMRIGIDGGCLANRRGFGRFARQTLAALAEAPSRHEFVVFVDRPSSPGVHVPERFERVVVERGRGAEPRGVGLGPAAGRRHARDGPGGGAGGARPDLLPGDLQLLPRLERPAGRRHDARHAGAGTSRAGLPDLAGPGRVGDQGARRGALGRPDPDRLGGGPPRPAGLVPAARGEGPGRDRGPRRRLPAEAPRPRVGRGAGAVRDRAGRALPPLRRRAEPAQEPAPADRGVRPGGAGRRGAGPGRRPRRRLPHPRPRAPRGGRAVRPGRAGRTSRGSCPTTTWCSSTTAPTPWCSRR